MTTALSTPPLQGRLPVAWEKLARCKRAYFGSVAHYNIGMALLWAPSAADADASRLVHVLMNAHSRAAAATAEHTLSRRPVYTDAALETPRGRLLLGNNSASLNLGATLFQLRFLQCTQSAMLSLSVLAAIFPGGPGLAGTRMSPVLDFIGTNGDGGGE